LIAFWVSGTDRVRGVWGASGVGAGGVDRLVDAAG
jgi:hypothetical protein